MTDIQDGVKSATENNLGEAIPSEIPANMDGEARDASNKVQIEPAQAVAPEKLPQSSGALQKNLQYSEGTALLF